MINHHCRRWSMREPSSASGIPSRGIAAITIASAGGSSTSPIATRKCPPAPARSTLGAQGSTVPGPVATSHPKAAAVRIRVPALPGSETMSHSVSLRPGRFRGMESTATGPRGVLVSAMRAKASLLIAVRGIPCSSQSLWVAASSGRARTSSTPPPEARASDRR